MLHVRYFFRMRILICVKAVPKGDGVPYDAERMALRRDKAAQALNPMDCAALEQAFRLKERHGGSVTVLSMGPPSVENLLREICALPVDEVFLITDSLYAGSDTLATARVLAATVGRLGGFDLILLGNRATDGETGQVGPELAALLGITACVTNITGECAVEGRSVRCVRLLEESLDTMLVALPAVLTVCGGEYTLRPPSIAGMRNAKNVVRLGNAELGLSSDDAGGLGSATRVVKIRPARVATRSVRWVEGAEAGAAAILDVLRHPHPQGAIAEILRDEVGAQDFQLNTRAETVWAASVMGDLPGERAALELASVAVRLGMARESILLQGGNDSACACSLAELATEKQPDIILMPATIRGRCVASYCAALLRTGLTADCTELALDGQGGLLQIRPAFGGGMLAEICSRRRPQMATVRVGVFPALAGMSVPPVILDSGNDTGNITLLESTPLGVNSLREAGVIFTGGKGIGGKDGFAFLERLAGVTGAALGASRSAVDAGYAPYMRQVGQTGVTVRPDVYVAFAVSGAVQHLAGIRDAGTVVAVNTDRKAPVFSHADIGIIAPWRDVAEELMRLFEG